MIKSIIISILFFGINIQAQTTQSIYLDKIDFWKKESFNKNVKEVYNEYNEYTDYYRNESQLLKQRFTKFTFDKFGKLTNQTSKNIHCIGSRRERGFTKTVYDYDDKNRLINEKCYLKIDSISFEPIDTSIYSLKVYKYDLKGNVREYSYYNDKKKLTCSVNINCDTLKNNLEIIQTDYSLYGNNYEKRNYRFDEKYNIVEQTYYRGSKCNGITIFKYDSNGRKIEEKYQAYDSHLETIKRISYNDDGLIEELRENSNIDPGDSKFYTYTFDKHKNWITKETKNSKGVILEKQSRKITYY